MPQPSTIIDAPGGETHRHGSQIITFAIAGTLIAEEINFSKAMRSLDIGDEFGITRKAAYSTMKGAGSMIVQIKSNIRVLAGDSGAFLQADGSSLPFLVTGAGVNYSQNGITKMSIEFAERLATSTDPRFVMIDGDFTTATPCGAFRFIGHPLPAQANAIVLAIKHCQFRANWSPDALGSAGPFAGQNTYLVDETQLEDTGVAGVVTWDKVYASLPNPYSTKQVTSKTYQWAQYIFNSGSEPWTVNTESLVSWTLPLTATVYHDYFLTEGAVPGLPVIPFLMSIRWFNNTQILTDTGTGFPRTTIHGCDVWNNNGAFSFLGASVEPYMGRMVVLKKIYG